MTHQMHLNSEPFHAIKSGFKSIELRLYDEKRKQIKIGDSIEFICTDNENETIIKKVVDLHIFPSFDILYENLPLLKCGYTPFTLPLADPKQTEKYYSKESQAKYSVVGIELEEEPLQRFISGQSGTMTYCSSYDIALKEIRSGHKETHWIWYVFPQLRGLTSDTVTEYYALNGRAEAKEYISHSILGTRLVEISTELLNLDACDLMTVLGRIDAYKLRSSMTLFDKIAPEKKVFSAVLEKYCMGIKDNYTLQII